MADDDSDALLEALLTESVQLKAEAAIPRWRPLAQFAHLHTQICNCKNIHEAFRGFYSYQEQISKGNAAHRLVATTEETFDPELDTMTYNTVEYVGSCSTCLAPLELLEADVDEWPLLTSLGVQYDLTEESEESNGPTEESDETSSENDPSPGGSGGDGGVEAIFADGSTSSDGGLAIVLIETDPTGSGEGEE